MPKLCELVAVFSGKKAETEAFVTNIYHRVQKGDLYDGMRKTYAPVDEGGEVLPPESKNAQANLKADITSAVNRWAELIDLTASVDAGNQLAKADIVVGEKVLAKDVPVPTLLFLEKQLTSVKTFVEKIPVPDPSERWTYDPNTSQLTTEPRKTSRTKKQQRPLVMYDATPEHPAQTQLVTEDVLAGYWTTTHFTTRLPADDKAEMLARVETLLDAVKTAKERANSTAVTNKVIGAELLNFVFAGRQRSGPGRNDLPG